MSSAKFYTLAPMRTSTILASVHVSSSYPAQNVLDYNRNTQCRGSSTSSIRIDISFGTTQTIRGLIIDIRNYALHNVNGVDRYANLTTFISNGPALPRTQPLLANSFSIDYSCNTFRLTFNSGSPNVQLGMIALCHVYELANRHQVPSMGGRTPLVTQTILKGGKRYSSVENQNGVKVLQQKYFLSSSSELTIMKNIFKESAELGLPFVLVDGDEDPLMLYWDSPISWQEIDYEVYEASCSFVEVPYIESGKTF